MNLLSNAVAHTTLSPLLDFENPTEDQTGDAPEGGEIYYEEPDLSGGIEGVDYGIVYREGNQEEEAEQ